MTKIYKDGNFLDDQWKFLDNGDALPAEGEVFVSIQRWVDEKAKLIKRELPVGVVIRAGEKFELVMEDVEYLASIAVEFPKFSDGRSFSIARILSEHAGFDGEIRAIGDVLLDQIPFMRRCGISVFEISHEPTIRALKEGHNPEMSLHTQPVGLEPVLADGARPWLRKGEGNSTLAIFAG